MKTIFRLSVTMIFAAGLVLASFAQGPPPSWWGGQVIDVGTSLWHAEAFPVGTDTFNCWGVDNQGQDYGYIAARDWATGLWTVGGVQLPANEAPSTIHGVRVRRR